MTTLAPEKPATSAAAPAVGVLPGLRFSERMAGYFHPGASDYEHGWEEGRARGTALRFSLTASVAELDDMLRDPEHSVTLAGNVECAALSAHPLTISSGEIELFGVDRDRVGAREIVYRLSLSSVEGPRFVLEGRMDLHDDPGFDLWSDITTLLVVVRKDDASAAEVGRGVLRIGLFGSLRALTTLRTTGTASTWQRVATVWSFSRFLLGQLRDVYGGVFSRAFVHEAGEPLRQRRALRLPAAEVLRITTDDGVELKLTRFQGGAKGPVIVAPGMGTSTLSLTIDTVDTNLAEFLCAAGYDVWLFDYRASPALAAARQQCSLDDIALQDYPAAIREVRRVTGAPSVQVVAHCVGSITLLMSLAAGKAAEVRSAICSQTTMFLRTTPLIRLKTTLPLGSLLELLGFHLLEARFDSSARWTDRLYEALLRFYPTHRGERCDSPVCRRIRFIYGETYQHRALNHETHRLLYQIFGEANLTVLQHLARNFRKGFVVDRTGRDVYVSQLQRMKVPITFIQGANNRIFTPRGSELTWRKLAEANGEGFYQRKVFPDYAHMDLFIGKHADRDVYPYLVEQLDQHN